MKLQPLSSRKDRCALLAAALICTFAVIALGQQKAPQSRAAAANSADILAARDSAEKAYRQKLGELERWCGEQQLTEAARFVRGWLPVRDPLKSYVFKLAGSLAPPPAFRAEGPASEIWTHFADLRKARAKLLFELAKQSHAVQEFALAYDLVREACRENPDHAEARRILGYVRYNGGWALPDTARRLSAGQVYHDKFGWLPRAHVNRYEQGQRYAGGRWITAEEDERRHTSIKSGWRIDSEHYAVTTNHSLEEGVRLSRRLEQLHDVWRHVFVDYFSPEFEMRRWFEEAAAAEGGAAKRGQPSVVRRLHQVTHFRNREEYKNTLRPMQPQIDITLGIYFAQSRIAYFFAEDEQYHGTLLHEGTHQLFQETRQTGKDAGATSNFSLIEAVACYMESLAEEEHWYTLGGMDEGRVPAARKRLLADQFYVPLAEVTALGMRNLQRDERLPKVYSQISGQALFFMHAGRGQYRRSFIETLIAIYTGKADAATLAKQCGRTFQQLDDEYRTFMQTMKDE